MASTQAHSAVFPLPTELEAIVFDCDGLLLDTETCWSRAESALFHAHGREFGLAEKQLVIGKTVEGVGEVMAEYFGRPGEGALLSAELLEGVRRELADGVDALPGAADLVRACAERLPVAVASNSPRSLLETALQSSGLAGLLPLSFAADEVAAPKPAPDLYLTACRALGADPASCVAFEDSHTGIRAARAAGLHLVTVPSLAGQELDHDWLPASLADPELQAWARALRPAGAHAAD